MAGYTQEEYKLARDVNMVDYLRNSGYELRKEGVSDYAVIIRDHSGEHDSLKISADGKKWNWYINDVGGKSQIELLKRLENLSTIEAIKKLASFSNYNASTYTDKPINQNIEVDEKKAKKFVLPEKWSNNKRAYAYLTETRGLDPEIVSYCFEQGLIYESKKFHNVVFVGQRNEHGEAQHASLRGTYTTAEKPFKGDVAGSDKKYSFALEGKGQSLDVYESAIDALSDASMEKAKGEDWQQLHRVTLGGMSDKSLELYLTRHSEIKEIIFRLDNDIDGKDKDGNPQNHGQIRVAALMEKYQGLGYKVDNQVPEMKDINADLLRSRGNVQTDNKNELVGSEAELETSDIMQKLEQGVKSVFTSQDYLSYLKIMSKFHRYSVNNCILIKRQMSSATMVAGYNAWKRDFERQVKKGEQGITVLAPAEYKYKEMQKEIDKVTGRETQKEVEKKRLYFKPVTVFDVSQTDGKEIPSLTKELDFSVEQVKLFIDAITNIAAEKNVNLEFEILDGSRKGYTTKDKIVIKEGMSDAQTIKTAVHELCHSRLHISTEGITAESKSTVEVQAESVAFIVSDYFGIDTSEYSFPYIASWSSGKEVEELKNSLNVIKKEATAIITDIEKELNRLKEKELSLSENVRTVSIKNHEIATELFNKDIPLFTMKDGKVTLINTSKELQNSIGNTFITTSDLEKNKDNIPDVYDGYLVSLFQRSYEINPIETLKIFNIPYAESELNKIALVEDPLIKEGIFNSKKIDDIKIVIPDRLKKFNSIKGKVKVQILKSEIDIFQKGELLNIKSANDKINNFNFDIRNKDISQTITFGLYVSEKNKWKYGVSKFDVKDIFAEDLIDFIDKTMDKKVYLTCQIELDELEKNQNSKEKNKEEKLK